MLSESAIRRRVRQVVQRTLGIQPGPGHAKRPLVTEKDLKDLAVGSEFRLPPGALVTPLARQAAMERRIRLLEASPASSLAPSGQPSHGSGPAAGQKVVAIGADHGGFGLKESLKKSLQESGYRVVDCGTDSPQSVDYPDFALAVAQLVSQGRAWRGIMIDGAGIGSCMAANKVPGVRAAMCYDVSSALNSREHNDANLLTLGAGLIGPNAAQQIVKTWLETPFAGGRHARRVDKIMAIERRYCQPAARPATQSNAAPLPGAR
jgi:ribose 5-phosphate isomerase B